MKRILLVALVCLSALAQEGANVNQSAGPPYIDYTRLLFYSATDKLEYICLAQSQQPTATFARSDSTLTNIVDLANTSTVTTASAHGLVVGNLVTFVGATVDTDLNGSYYVQTVGSTTTFTVTTASVTDATYTEATLKFTTNAPRTTRPIWKIEKLSYDAVDDLLIRVQSTSGMNSICDDRSSTTGSTKTTYR